MNLKQAIASYTGSQQFRALAPFTKKSYTETLVELAQCFDQRVEIDTVSDNLYKFAEHLEAKKMVGRSIQLRITITKLMLRWLGQRSDFSYRVPSQEIKKYKVKHEERWLTDEEVEMCLNYKFKAHMRYGRQVDDPTMCHIMVRVFVETGIRTQELTAMEWGDIDLDEGIIRIQVSKTRPRFVFISPETIELLRKEKPAIYAYNLKVFPGMQVQTRIKRMLLDLKLKGIRDGRGAHTFRHYFATKMYYDGKMKLQDVAGLMGDMPGVVLTHYLHPTPRMLKYKVYRAMGWKFSPSGRTPQVEVPQPDHDPSSDLEIPTSVEKDAEPVAETSPLDPQPEPNQTSPSSTSEESPGQMELLLSQVAPTNDRNSSQT